MYISNLSIKAFVRLAFGFICWLMTMMSTCYAQEQIIILKDQPITVIPGTYFFKAVTDDRSNKLGIRIIPTQTKKRNEQAEDVDGDFIRKPDFALMRFVAHNLPSNKSLRSVTISIRKLEIDERLSTGGVFKGNIVLVLAFNAYGADELVIHLTDYSGTSNYTRSPGPAQDIEPALRKLIINGLVYFDSWMKVHALNNSKLAKRTEVAFNDIPGKTEDDTVYYAKNRPLTWDDFKSKPFSSRYDAEVFPTIGYNEHTEIANGVINIVITLKVGLAKSACWVKEGKQNDYALNHEQRHFDIAEIAGQRFKKKLLSEHLPVGNFDGFINSDYLDAYREMNVMEKLYDDETNHGENSGAQEKWNSLIDQELKTYSLK